MIKHFIISVRTLIAIDWSAARISLCSANNYQTNEAPRLQQQPRLSSIKSTDDSYWGNVTEIEGKPHYPAAFCGFPLAFVRRSGAAAAAEAGGVVSLLLSREAACLAFTLWELSLLPTCINVSSVNCEEAEPQSHVLRRR